ncbi:MAG: hypothetical protein WBQ60_02505 [Asticcacaulis sp.]
MNYCRFGIFISSLALLSLIIQACSPARSESATKSSFQTISETTSPAPLKWSDVSRVDEAALKPSDAPTIAAEDFAKGQCNLYAIRNWSWSILGKGAPAFAKSSTAVTANQIEYRVVYIMGVSDAASPKAEEFAKTYNEIALKNCGAKQ